MTMQNNKINLVMLLLLLLGVSCDSPVDTVETETTPEPVSLPTEKYQAIVDSIYAAYPNSIGLIVHIESPKNGISWSGSNGYSNLESKAPLDPEQPVLIASSIKTYIAATILRLHEDEKLSIEDNISKHLSAKTIALFEADGYDFDSIKIKHLLSHTSGIADYVNEDYMVFIDENQKYRWTRDEQLELATKVADPLGKAQEAFSYADVNFLLCTEIIEQLENKPFPEAMRELLKYDQLGLSNTWFPTLEEKPEGTKDLANQYWIENGYGPSKLDFNWNSAEHDISWDLYGGGGIATTTKELAQFSYHLFNGSVIEDQEVFNLIKTDVETTDGKPKSYRLGIAETEVMDLKSFGHGGFWGTMVFYIPKLDAAISVTVLERNGKMKVIRSTLNTIVSELSQQLIPAEHITADSYELYKAKDSKATLVLFPGGGATAKDTKAEFDVLTAATANNVSVVFMNINGGLWMDSTATNELTQELESVFTDHELDPENTFIGGMSIGGNAALTVSNHLIQKKSSIAPKGVFIVDSPLDLYALYESSIKDIANPNLGEDRLAEPKWIVSNFEEAFSKNSLLTNIQNVSPFTVANQHTSVPNLKAIKLRFYTEPDTVWYKEVRQTDFESTNAYAIQQIAKDLKSKNWNQFELIETENKGFRADGERHPHSWSIVDVSDLVEWILQ